MHWFNHTLFVRCPYGEPVTPRQNLMSCSSYKKKAIRIITNKTSKIEGKFQDTKPLFKRANVLTIQNLYFYPTTTETKTILTKNKPEQISALFTKSVRSNIILPKFNTERCKSNSFIFNSSKMVNHITNFDFK